MSLLPQALVNGVALAAIYAFVALGLTLVFGVLDVVNFAYGQMLLVASYLTYELTRHGTNIWLVLVILVVAFAAGGAVVERTLFFPVRNVPINSLLVSIGLISIISNVIADVWGPNQYLVERPVQGSFAFAGIFLAKMQVIDIVFACGIMLALAAMLKFTSIGRAMRATAQNRDAAALMGVPVNRINTLAFAISASLAAVTGVLVAAMFPVGPGLGDAYLVYGFTALIIGGAGSPLGAVIGAVLTGCAISVTQTLSSSLVASVAPFLAIIAILYFRPQGIVRVRTESTL